MAVRVKMKTIDNKIEQNKTQYKLDRQSAKISGLSPEKVNKYEFNGWRCSTRKILVRKSSYNQKIWIFTIR